MNKLAIAVILAAIAAASASAEPPAAVKPRPGAESPGARSREREVRLPGVDYTFVFPSRPSGRLGAPPADELLRAVATWLHVAAGLKKADSLPRVRLESPTKITNFRFTGVLSDDPDVSADVPRGQREVVAAYDRLSRTIYLPEGWRGATPTEVSILVHEMVHHLQHEAKERYACPEAAEAAAYAAQDRWLNAFGRTLAADFDIDAFTLLVTSHCNP